MKPEKMIISTPKRMNIRGVSFIVWESSEYVKDQKTGIYVIQKS